MITTILSFLFALGILITFHEFGHYWAARRCGVKVLRFSVGFGKPLWRRVDKNGTEWAVAGIPLGGYVKMQDEPAPDADPAAPKVDFSSQPVRNRFFIVSAGPMANFILAAFLYAGLSWVGSEEPAPILAAPAANTAAQMAGIEAGDRVISVDGQTVTSWRDVRWQMLDQSVSGGRVELTVDRFDRKMPITLILPASGAEPDTDALALAGIGLDSGLPQIGQVQSGSAAAAAGLQTGDIVQSIGPLQEPGVRQMIELVQMSAGETLPLTINRAGALLNFSIVPQATPNDDGQNVGRIGVSLGSDVPMVTVQHGPIDSLWQGSVRTFETAWFSLKMLGKMVTGAVSWKNISGPVTIADYAGQTARVGLASYIAFIALVSVSIGVLNLLPIPMLDGGHLMFYVIEMVRGKPAPAKWMEVGQRAGVFVLAGLMTLAIFNDLTRLLS
jgi:regulator of sigma E protease